MIPEQAAEAAGEAPRADVELRVPAQGAYVAVLRTTTAALAARLDFTIDDVEDLRIAVGEASAIVLPHAAPGTDLWCRFTLARTRVTVTVTVPVDTEPVPDLASFAWTVLNTLASEATIDTDEGQFTIRLTVVSSLAGADG
jgi:serine/threonine-protein kinase RsbW